MGVLLRTNDTQSFPNRQRMHPQSYRLDAPHHCSYVNPPGVFQFFEQHCNSPRLTHDRLQYMSFQAYISCNRLVRLTIFNIPSSG